MGRPKGSKNKPKVQDPAVVPEKVLATHVGQVIFEKTPIKKVYLPEEPPTKKRVILPDNGGSVTPSLAPSKSYEEEPEEDDEPTLEDALKELGGEGEIVKKQRGLKQKKMKEQIEFLLEEMKHMRLFVCRVEDMMLEMLKVYPVVTIPVPELKKTRGKTHKQVHQSQPSTNPIEEESKNETETKPSASV